tara:strand:+ start:671 stop:1411 length:741 start_codon:yes stop_codon:yes gene_type:complete
MELPANAPNLVLIAVMFGLLIGSTVSQKARCGLAYVMAPMLTMFSLHRVSGGYDLVKELTFYASYHTDWRNQVVHVIFVPLLVATGMVFLAYAPPLVRARPLGLPLNWAMVAATAWSLHFVHADLFVGSLVALLTYGMAVGATALVDREQSKAGAKGVPDAARYGQAAMWAGLLHVFGWYMQLHPGHAIFEGRKAALVDALMQSFMDAPLFVWMEVAFALGYDPALSHQLHSAVVAQHAEWARAAA